MWMNKIVFFIDDNIEMHNDWNKQIVFFIDDNIEMHRRRIFL